jgi:citrate synthase
MAVAQTTGAAPTLDLGLVVMAQALGLPPGTALTLFAIGRTVGWIGHAIEQYQLDQLIRPRARYTGKATTSR